MLGKLTGTVTSTMCQCCPGRGVEEPQAKEVETGDTKALETFKGDAEVGGWVGGP